MSTVVDDHLKAIEYKTKEAVAKAKKIMDLI